jgi:Kef-type K+ transport system membrane component KefB
MKLLFIIIFLIGIGLFGSRRIFSRNPAYLGASHAIQTGLEYLLLGLILGSTLLNIIDQETLRSLAPYISFGLGWVGFLFGHQFKIKILSRLPRRYFSISLIKACISFLIILILSFCLLKWILHISGVPLYLGSLVLAVTGSCTSPSALAMADKSLGPDKPLELLKLLRYISSIDGLVGITIFGLSLCVLNTNDIFVSKILSAFTWVFVSILIGLFMGYLFHFLITARFSDEELLLIVIGTTTLTSGIALHFKLSPLFMNFLMGVIITNSPWSNFRLSSILIRMEKPVYIVLLLIIGAMWIPDIVGIGAGLVYVVFRIMGKTLGTLISTKIFRPRFEVPMVSGLTLVSQGGLALAILINFSLVYSGSWIEIIKSAVITGIIINTFISPNLILYVLKKENLK